MVNFLLGEMLTSTSTKIYQFLRTTTTRLSIQSVPRKMQKDQIQTNFLDLFLALSIQSPAVSHLA
ncbi:MAG TPA: hypothetical protein VFM31_05755 [Nitrososphaeraceae archaeon]|nr:hypothetical protein [Nitrososphaeraceae archaeon]